MEEQKLTPAEAFFMKKAEFEHNVTEAVKNFAGTFATDVKIAVSVAVETAVAQTGEVVECRIKGVEVETKYTQDV